eukprot:TRINITY_DN1496_c0_g1_i9.p1 TRINITY_DN1496_c0_g1~~TRINITY_DN1496_c0_g1_i9.p1  ORF type:complete len:325 (-),score=58.44 TRINITY_DN1496_c0_g1_i9:207-1061(-)
MEPQSDEEKSTCKQISESLGDGAALLDTLKDYSGCEEPIRKALNDPNPKTEQTAWKAVSAAVDQLYDFYQYSLAMEKAWPQLLDRVCTDNPLEGVKQNLALTYQLAKIFDFVFHFDEKKMVNPAIQNDFSYYRRVLGRMRDKSTKLKVDEELANKMSFFFAYPTPMMKVLIDATTEYDAAAKPCLVGGLSTLANLCLGNITTTTLDDSKSILLLCCMTGCIILVDHLRPEGAFDRKSPIRIRLAISLLKTGTSYNTDFLVNSLRFTTLHLNDETTMPAITKLLA